ncbi:MAG: metallophosphoesterase [Armatimonadetes bacterium]|nr:metallophosphoesterase [Armatimonadota bacterium]
MSVKGKVTRRKVLGWCAAGCVGLGMSQFDNRNDLRIERSQLKLPRWDADGFTAAFLSDMHTDSRQQGERAAHAARMAIQEKPDVILVGGDFVSSMSPMALPLALSFVDVLMESKIPCYAVLGNHDYWVKETPRVIRELSSKLQTKRSRLLRNETVEVSGVTIAGVDDGIAGRDRHDFLARHHDKNTLLMFHEPDFVVRVDKRASLMLAGHSHGGQMCLPFGISLHTPRGAKKYIKGFYDHAKVPLYVSRGIGTVGPDRRVFCPPEVSILTLSGA